MTHTKKIEQPWGDYRLKLNGTYIGCSTKENADYIMALEGVLYSIAIGAFPQGEAAAENLARNFFGMER